MVKNINPSGGSDPSSLANLGGTLFFSADDGTNGTELWKSDGTEAGTTMVKDINLGAGGSDPQHLTNVGGTLFFSADDGSNGAELWRSDGTEAGTTMVKDINLGTGGSQPRALADIGGTLFFSAYDGPQGGGTHGREPWMSNGTEGGTTLVKDINTSPSVDSNPTLFNHIGGTLFFDATDGTDNGTTQHGYELWKSVSPFDATSTTLVKDIKHLNDGNPSPLVDVGGTLFFAADDVTTGRELWKSVSPFDDAHTYLVKDINTSPSPSADSLPRALIDIGGTLLFSAEDATNGRELWKSVSPFDDAHTSLVKDINTSGDGYPYYLTDFGGSLFFNANDGGGAELWKSASPFDPTSTTLFKDINPSGASAPRYLTDAGSALFFAAFDATSGQELWSSDGTATGTTQVKDIKPSAGGSYPRGFTEVGNTLFFQADDGTNGVELWKAFAPPGPATGGGPPGTPSNQFNVAGKKGNEKKGTVQYTFNLPAGGLLSAIQAGNLSAEAVAAKGGTLVKPGSVTATQAGPVRLTIRPTKRGRSVLAQKGKLRVSVKFTFTPTGGSPASQRLKVLLKLA
jgi:ELWxxDGT repeat protein